MKCTKQNLYDVMWETAECESQMFQHQHIHIIYEYAPRQDQMDFNLIPYCIVFHIRQHRFYF
jgi:hypothetical protein